MTEYVNLHDHVAHCAQTRGRLHPLHCLVEAVDAFLAPRFVTTLALTVLLLVAAALAA